MYDDLRQSDEHLYAQSEGTRFEYLGIVQANEKLMNEALKATGLKTKKETVELGLRTLIKLNKQEEIKGLKGKLK